MLCLYSTEHNRALVLTRPKPSARAEEAGERPSEEPLILVFLVGVHRMGEKGPDLSHCLYYKLHNVACVSACQDPHNYRRDVTPRDSSPGIKRGVQVQVP